MNSLIETANQKQNLLQNQARGEVRIETGPANRFNFVCEWIYKAMC